MVTVWRQMGGTCWPTRAASSSVSDNFAGNGLLASCTNHDGPHLHEHKVAGLWKGPQVHYMGVKFSISGETHYGWVRLRDFVCGLESPFMVGYAYETVANKPIQKGHPGTDEPTLGALDRKSTRLNSS